MSAKFNKNHPLNAAKRAVMATLITSDIDQTVKAYEEELGYRIQSSSIVSKEMANIWSQPEISGYPLVIMAPESGNPVFLRFIGIPGVKVAPPGPGWFALELCVRNSAKLYEKLMQSSYFKPFAKPAPLPFSDAIIPMQCKGNGSEILYLNEVRGNLPDLDLPMADSEVDHLFISILSARSLDMSAEYYCNALNMIIQERHKMPYKTINRVYGLPLDTQHELVTLGENRMVTLEIDQAPASAKNSDDLCEGIWMISFAVESLENIPSAVLINDQPYKGAKMAFGEGPDGEKFELIEIPEGKSYG